MLLCAPNKDYMNYIKRRSVCEQYIPVYVYPKGKKNIQNVYMYQCLYKGKLIKMLKFKSNQIK